MSAAALPPADRLRIVILGLSITSSWGNGHATTYRGLVRALCRRGRQVLFLERDAPWYRDTRDLPQPPFGTTRLYNSVTELRERWTPIWPSSAPTFRMGSRSPSWCCGPPAGSSPFTTSTPRSLWPRSRPNAAIPDARADPRLRPLSLVHRRAALAAHRGRIRRAGGARAIARSIHCHRPAAVPPEWDLGYLGTYRPTGS